MLAGQIWKALFYRRLKGQPEPLFLFSEQVVSAAALWMGVRLWMQRWQKGDPIVLCATGEGPEYLEVFIATLVREGSFIAAHPEKGSEYLSGEINRWQPDYIVLNRRDALEIPGYRICSEVNEHRNAILLTRIHDYNDLANGHPLRKMASTERRVILSTSGTTNGAGRWALLSDQNIFSVLRSHVPRMNIRGATVQSVLPWNHAFGLILDLLPALLTARMVIRDSGQGALALHKGFAIDYVSAVPALFTRWLQDDGWTSALAQYRGGILGGAPVSEALADELRGSRFRIGYGQTEASPGITLGKAGEFEANFLGSPLGCEVAILEGTLHYRGDNVCEATVTLEKESSGTGSERAQLEDALHLLEDSIRYRNKVEWQDTGDVAEPVNAGFRYLGRADHNFKLSNGRFLDAVRWEHSMERSLGLPCFILPQDGGIRILFVIGPELSNFAASSWREKVAQHARLQLGSLEGYVRSTEFIQKDDLPVNGKGVVIRSELASGRSLLRDDYVGVRNVS